MENTDHIVVIQQPNSEVAESYRSLRASLTRHISRGKRRIALVSTWSGDGKSMVCTNLSVVLSQLHLNVVLVDGDLRLPTISKVLGMDQYRGFTDYLEGGVELEELLQATPVPNLRVLPRGLSTENPANLLGRERLATLFQTLQAEADCVIVDTPPLTACSDAILIGVQADAAILVVNPKSWDGDVEARQKQQLLEHNIEVLGVVLNGASDSENRGYGSAYSNTYRYKYNYVSRNAPSPSDSKAEPRKGWFKRN
jgi:succinoglycan biosynthesis transport protein ExoP